MSPEPSTPSVTPLRIPKAVQDAFEGFSSTFSATLRLHTPTPGGGAGLALEVVGPPGRAGTGSTHRMTPAGWGPMEVEVLLGAGRSADALAELIGTSIQRVFEYEREMEFFTRELAERYEEINLLYSIGEILGSILEIDDATEAILKEVCDVLRARRGFLWLTEGEDERLRLVAEIGGRASERHLALDDRDALAPRVYREGRPIAAVREDFAGAEPPDIPFGDANACISVPIRHAPSFAESRTTGVMTLVGRGAGERFTPSEKRLLSAVAAQLGTALENTRLQADKVSQERIGREMELAHDLQMKLLPAAETFDAADVAAEVRPADSVGGDFYHLFKLQGGRIGVMIGDVSGHGFSAALMMALTMSAATIYAAEYPSPSDVLRHVHEALREELETTETYLTLFYGVLDPEWGILIYSNAGHPHAFMVRADGSDLRLGATQPPIGIADPETFCDRSVAWSAAHDLLFLFTDGLSDPLQGSVGERGEDRLVQKVVELRGADPREIVRALFRMEPTRSDPQEGDDRTVVVLRGAPATP